MNVPHDGRSFDPTVFSAPCPDPARTMTGDRPWTFDRFRHGGSAFGAERIARATMPRTPAAASAADEPHPCPATKAQLISPPSRVELDDRFQNSRIDSSCARRASPTSRDAWTTRNKSNFPAPITTAATGLLGRTRLAPTSRAATTPFRACAPDDRAVQIAEAQRLIEADRLRESRAPASRLPTQPTRPRPPRARRSTTSGPPAVVPRRGDVHEGPEATSESEQRSTGIAREGHHQKRQLLAETGRLKRPDRTRGGMSAGSILRRAGRTARPTTTKASPDLDEG